MRKFLFFLLISCTFLKAMTAMYQPPYQVMLYVRHENTKTHYCNGVIVQRRLILTTATCVHTRNSNDSMNKLIDIHDIEIIAGSSSSRHEPIVFEASSIYLADGFNNTREKDFALISLKVTLPLGFRDDIKWIMLDNTGIKVGKGLTYLTYSNCYNRVKGNLQMTDVLIVDSKVCNLKNLYSTELCSYYQLYDELDCEDFNEFLHEFGDRGTGLIKNSCLVAILSDIAPHLKHKYQSISESCSYSLMNASYTAIAPYAEWIYYVIAYKESIDVEQGQHQVSTPYHTRDLQAIYSAECKAAKEEVNSTKKPRIKCYNHGAEKSGLASKMLIQSNFSYKSSSYNKLLLFNCIVLLYTILKYPSH